MARHFSMTTIDTNNQKLVLHGAPLFNDDYRYKQSKLVLHGAPLFRCYCQQWGRLLRPTALQSVCAHLNEEVLARRLRCRIGMVTLLLVQDSL